MKIEANTFAYKILFEAPDVSVYFEEEHSIFKIVWNGNVSFESFKSLAMSILEQSKTVDKGHILGDRRNLKTISTEARAWFRNNFSKTDDGRKLILKIDKMAVIDSSSVIQHVISDIIVNQILRRHNPNITYESFSNEKIARDWLLNTEVEKKSLWKFFDSLLLNR